MTSPLTPVAEKTMPTPRSEVLAVGAAEAAVMFSIGLRTWWRWNASGKCPKAFRINGRVLWRIVDLERWSAAGFPGREQFQQRPET